MNKRLILLATGVCAALAFAVLPIMASAGEFAADCENGAATCSGTIAGGVSQLRNDAGEGITCSVSHGTFTINNNSSTGTMIVRRTGCKETITGFNFSCNNTGVAGEISSGTMVVHRFNIESLPSPTIGTKITFPASGETFTCAGFAKKLVTGSVMGHMSNPNCGSFQASHTVDFSESATGVQKYMQMTTTGETSDLISSNDAGGAYTTSAFTGSLVMTWSGTKVKITC